jgi:hypothetical protein
VKSAAAGNLQEPYASVGNVRANPARRPARISSKSVKTPPAGSKQLRQLPQLMG